MVKECVDVLLQLSVDHDAKTVYKRDLEPAVLTASEAFYSAEGKQLLETCDAPEYLRRVCILSTQRIQVTLIMRRSRHVSIRNKRELIITSSPKLVTLSERFSSAIY